MRYTPKADHATMILQERACCLCCQSSQHVQHKGNQKQGLFRQEKKNPEIRKKHCPSRRHKLVTDKDLTKGCLTIPPSMPRGSHGSACPGLQSNHGQTAAHQETSFHCFEDLLVSGIANHLGLVDEGEGVADCCCLLQPARPPHGHLLKGCEVAIHHRQHPMQLRLHSHAQTQYLW